MFVVLLIQVQVPPERQTNANANARQVSAYTSLHTDNSGGASWHGMAWHFPRPPVQGGPLSGDNGPLQEEPHQRNTLPQPTHQTVNISRPDIVYAFRLKKEQTNIALDMTD